MRCSNANIPQTSTGKPTQLGALLVFLRHRGFDVKRSESEVAKEWASMAEAWRAVSSSLWEAFRRENLYQYYEKEEIYEG